MVAGEAQTGKLEKRYLRRDGCVIWAALSTSLLRGPDGAPLYFISQMQDITPRHEAEDALRRSEETFRSVFEQATTGLALVELDGRFRSVNPALRRLLDYPEADLLRSTLQAVTHPQEREESGLLMQRMLDGSRETGALVQRYVRRDGREVWGHVAMTLVRNPTRPRLHVVQVRTSRGAGTRRGTSHLRKTYRLLFENNPQPMWVYDSKSLAFLAVNDAAVHLYGFSRAEFRAMSVRRAPGRCRASGGAQGPQASSATAADGAPAQGRQHDDRRDLDARHSFRGRDSVLVMIDLTGQEDGETLRRTERNSAVRQMEAIGRLASASPTTSTTSSRSSRGIRSCWGSGSRAGRRRGRSSRRSGTRRRAGTR